MKINENVGRQTSSFHIQTNNRNPLQRGQTIGFNKLNRDKVSISPKGNANSQIQDLIKQKQSITEQKDKLVISTLEQGGTLSSISEQLEVYDQQIKMLDEQVGEIMKKDVENKSEKKADIGIYKPPTEEDIQNEKLNTISKLSNELEQGKIVLAVKSKVDREARTLESEIKLDKMYAGSSDSAIKNIQKKEELLGGLRIESGELVEQFGVKMKDIEESAQENNNKIEAKNEVDEEV